MNEAKELVEQFVRVLSPLSVYLFGSASKGTDTENSDFDFFILVDEDVHDIAAATAKAYRAIREIKRRPVDIIVEHKSRFDDRKGSASLEREVFTTGVLLYDRSSCN